MKWNSLDLEEKVIVCCLVAMLVVLCVVIIGLVSCYTHQASDADAADAEAEYTFEADVPFGWEVRDYVDFGTGVHYLIYGDNRYGGITPRLNADGSLMLN